MLPALRKWLAVMAVALAACAPPRGAERPPAHAQSVHPQSETAVRPASYGAAPCAAGVDNVSCAYLGKVHSRFHTPYKEFVASLPGYGLIADPNLTVVVALAFAHDGSLAHAEVARTSTRAGFDEGALAALRDAAPYAAPPPSLRASDGLVHVIWTLYRSESGCGIWNARVIGRESEAAR